ncbi:MAG: hypothetical protein ABSE63_16205 [Thermoguttaceae bacterium]|jgi:hypothetical protein
MRATKKTILFSAILLALTVSAAAAQTPQNTEPVGEKPLKLYDWAFTPPMGWNSWDCYGAGVNQQDTLANADYMEKNLKSHG